MGKERHNHARHDNLGYPTRAIRTKTHLYIRNFKPDRWPMGDPPGYYCHTKMINPTKALLLSKQNDIAFRHFYEITYDKRPAEELYDVEADPDCLRNLVTIPESAGILLKARSRLNTILKEQADPRLHGRSDIFESYPYFGRMQPRIGGFKEQGKYNPRFLPLERAIPPTVP